jgi:hypothetical protein
MKNNLSEVKKMQRLAGLLVENEFDQTGPDEVSEGYSDVGVQELYPLIGDLSSLISTNSNLGLADKEAIFPILSQMTAIIDAIVGEDDDYINESDDVRLNSVLPSHIVKFLEKKRDEELTDATYEVADWAKQAGHRIIGGTAVGKDFDTLVLDITREGGEISIYSDYDENQGMSKISIDVNGIDVKNYNEFEEALGNDDTYFGLQEAGAKKKGKKKKNPGLWANVRAQREKGEAPARKGSKEYNSAVKAGKEINKNKK